MDNILPEHQRLNSYFNFIRPSTLAELNDRVEQEIQDTLLCSSGTSCAVLKSINNSKNDRILLQINTDPLRILYSPPEHDDNIDDAIFQQFKFPHLKRPLTSPTRSNTSSALSSSTLGPNPTAIPVSDELANASSINKSPAASFLANFISPVVANSLQHSDKTRGAIDGHMLGDSIGFGGFSTVHKATHIQTGRTVAVKIIQHQLMNELSSTRLDRELSIWRSLDHPNIAHLLKVVHIKAERMSYVFNDYCSGGNLLDHLNKCKQMEETKAKRLFRELCQGIQYLHVDRRVCHKDLKLENILLDGNGHIKICDFGLAIEILQQQAHRHGHKKTRRRDCRELEIAGGSLAYAAPEQIRQKTSLACPKTDTWSLGVILYTLTVGSLPFMDDYDLRLQQKILDGHFEIPNNVTLSNALKELIYACLAYEPEKRCDIDSILRSKWMSE